MIDKSRIALIVVVVVIFCTLLTYRMLLHQSTEHDLYVVDHISHNHIIFNHTDLNSFLKIDQNLRADSNFPSFSEKAENIIRSITTLAIDQKPEPVDVEPVDVKPDEVKPGPNSAPPQSPTDDIVLAYQAEAEAEALAEAEAEAQELEAMKRAQPAKVGQKPEPAKVEQKPEPAKKPAPVSGRKGGDDDDDVISASAHPQGQDGLSFPSPTVAIVPRPRVCPDGWLMNERGGCSKATSSGNAKAGATRAQAKVEKKPEPVNAEQKPPSAPGLKSSGDDDDDVISASAHPQGQDVLSFPGAVTGDNSTLPESVRELRPVRTRRRPGKDTRSHPHLSDRERERRQNLLYGDHHSWRSPQPGSHIVEVDDKVDHEELASHHPDEVHSLTDFTHAYSYMHCANQSRCIEPSLQLQPKLKIYYCKHPVTYGVRFYYLVREGLVLHPNVELVSDMDSADYIVYLPGSAPWHKTECNETRYASRLIVLDEFDFSYHFFPARNNSELRQKYEPMAKRREHGHIHNVVGNSQWWYYIYFKRSYVKRNNGTFIGYPHITQPHIYPITYSVAEAYVPKNFQFERPVDILCTLRGSKKMPTRQRVQDAVAAYVAKRNITNAITAQVSTASRTTVSTSYFDQMRSAEIIVTVNPAYWEGDFRLWESMASGALIFCDYLDVPHPHPLVHKQHVIFFDNQNMDELAALLDYYRSHKEKARRIAYNGYLFAMKYHRTVNMVDYVLRTTVVKAQWEREHSSWNPLKEAMPLSQVDPSVFMEGSKKPIPPEINYYGYNYTGQFLHYRASQQMAAMRLGLMRFNGSQA